MALSVKFSNSVHATVGEFMNMNFLNALVHSIFGIVKLICF